MDFPNKFPILFQRNWKTNKLDQQIREIETETLCLEYHDLKDHAPKRDPKKRDYFVGHDGIPSTQTDTNRREEHFAIALVNMRRRWPLQNGGWFRLLDYQVPLKGRQADKGVGKIDLLGLSDRGRLVVIELKVMGDAGGRSDPPVTALLEGLRYTSIVEANHTSIANEIDGKYGFKVSNEPPIVLLLAENTWWNTWLQIEAAGNWSSALSSLANGIEGELGISIQFCGLDDATLRYGADGKAPQLNQVPNLYSFATIKPEVFNAMHIESSYSETYRAYITGLKQQWWSWANSNTLDQLDGVEGEDRPPVFAKDHINLNVAVPSDSSIARRISLLIPSKQRHVHFGSFRSSQALTQSIFGAIVVYSRFDLLAHVKAECGRPAFFDTASECSIDFEHEVSTLGEPRPTSIDVLLRNRDQKIAIECKFTEEKFGECSRPILKPGHPRYLAQHCVGSYSHQRGRKTRCSLTEIGISYWSYAPMLFDWSPDQDIKPCPLGSTYQLARNAISSVVDGEGRLNPDSGHMLFVYDARNPAYNAGGGADHQYESLAAASRRPGLLRRVTWQQILSVLSQAHEFNWLLDEMQGKHGLVPSR